MGSALSSSLVTLWSEKVMQADNYDLNTHNYFLHMSKARNEEGEKVRLGKKKAAEPNAALPPSR